MNKSEWNILEKIEPMLTGEELFEKMKVFPEYNESIRKEGQAVRLLALEQIHSFYLPSAMSVEIYTKMYLAMIRAMKKKESKLAVQQRNLNRKNLRACVNGMEPSFGGIIGGSDSWSILGSSGVGKTTTIEKIIELFKGDHVIEMESPYCKIIPVISVQCPFDCGIKNLLFSILQKLDSAFGTSYYDNMVRAKANINTMLISTAQNLLNHVAVLCIDEVQNLIKHRAGMQLCSMLTELLNESSISIIFIGTPEIQPFFESVDYLARRTIGIKYERCYYDDYFRNFCRHLWKYQYVQKKTEISEVIIHWLYEHSAGTIAYVKFLYYTAQELSILNGREVVDLQALEEAYERMSMLHAHIQPEINLSKKSSEKRNISASRKKPQNIINVENDNISAVKEKVVQYVCDKNTDDTWTFTDIINEAKKLNVDMLLLLKGKVSITEIRVW